MAPDPPEDEDRTDVAPFERAEIEQPIATRFERVARAFAGRVALSSADARVSYRELAARVDALARALVARRGTAPETVLVFVRDDVASITALLACLQAGKIAVPANPNQPDARLALVLEDSTAPLVVTDTRHRDRARALASGRADVLELEGVGARASHDAPLPPPRADVPAYLIYTSGSTGRPKGVLQNQAAVLHNAFVHTHFLHVTPADRLTLLSARATGQWMTGVFTALLNGAALHPFDLRERGLTALARWIVDDRVTIYHSSATTFRDFADSSAVDLRASSLRVVKLGSEAVTARDVERFRARFPRECVLVNALSSTEATTICQCRVDRDTVLDGDLVPVGHPVSDVGVVLVGEDGAPVARGEVGEILVRSRYLASGYWNQPEATREAFAPDPDDPRVRVFRTGDVGRVRPDGLLEYLGRRDFRVKIRGQRVEPMEVEAALLGLDGVREAAVIAHDDERGVARLVAYVVSSSSSADAAAVRAALLSKLPRFMVPSGVVFVGALPRTSSGKLDRRALPAWQPERARVDSSLPRDLLETQLADIWADLLGKVDIHIGDDFFDLGGDSLLAVEMAVRVERECGVSVPLQDMVDALTIEKLAALLVGREDAAPRAPISVLQAGASKTPFVFAHGAIASDGFYCRGLARALGAERPFYVLQPHGLDGRPLPPTIEAMADDRLAALGAVQPRGPYLLGGFCAGGAVVFEMARRLRARGERVDLVVLIDTHAANARFRAWSRFVNTIAPMVGLSPSQKSALFRRGRTFLRGLRRASRRGIHQAVLFVVKKPFFVMNRAPEAAPPTSRAPLDARQKVWLHYHNALEDYVPARYAGRVVLFRSTHLEQKTPGNRTAGWERVCDSFTVHEIAGDHRTCVTTHVDDLAAKVRAALDAAG